MHGDQVLTEYFEDAPPNEPFEELTFDEDEVNEAEDVDPQDLFPDYFNDNLESFKMEPETELNETVPDVLEDVDFSEDITEIPVAEDDNEYLPGSLTPLEKEPEITPEETNWADDRDTSKFIIYLREAYPAGIPQHDGKSISGCEKAIAFLNRLNREISEAVRNDHEGHLNEEIPEIENIRVKIMTDVMKLQSRINKLKNQIKDSNKKKAEFNEPELKVANGLVKEATTAPAFMVMTTFERAVSGIIINAVVSAGHPFEDVYDYLKEKFELTPREELGMLQLLMDLGFPIFKDRGIIGGKDKDGKGTDGVDFLKNYFA